MVVDTTLVKLLAEQGEEGEGAIVQLLQGANDVVLPQVESALLEAGMHDLLSTLLYKRGETTRVLDIWSKMVDEVYPLGEGKDKADYVGKIYDQAAKSSDVEAVTKWAVWLLPHNRSLALKLVSDAKQPLKFDTRAVFARLAKVDQAGADLFLETVVLTGRDSDPTLHADLVRRAVDRVGEMLDNLDTRVFAREQEALYASSSPDTSFLSFLLAQPDDAPEAAFTTARLKSILLLSSGSAYDPAQLKIRLDELSAKSRGLTFERALVYGRLRLDRQALSLLVHTLHDLTSAGRYVRQGGDLVTPEEVRLIAKNLGLPAKAIGGKKKGSRKDGLSALANEPALARLLVEMSLSPPPPSSTDSTPFNSKSLIQLVQAHSAHLDPVETLSLLPSEWPLHLARPYLNGAIRRSLHARQEGMLLKGLANSENLEVTYQFGEVIGKMRGVLQRAPAGDGGSEEVVLLDGKEVKEDKEVIELR